jgi:hypothetical protein
MRIIEVVRKAGGRCILLDPNLVNYYAYESLREIAQEEGLPFLSARQVFEKNAPEGDYVLHDTNRKQRVMAIQIRGIPDEKEKKFENVFLVKTPKGRVRYPVYPGRPGLRDDGTMNDLIAGDGIYTAIMIDDGSRSFEFAPALEILMQGLTLQLFINNDVFYKLPDPESLETNGIYYSPVIEFRKPSFHEYLADFDPIVPNEKGALCIAEALLPEVLKALNLDR